MQYTVARKGHKVGHRPLVFGETVTARQLGVKQTDLEPFIARGVLKPAKVSIAAAPDNDKKDDERPVVRPMKGTA